MINYQKLVLVLALVISVTLPSFALAEANAGIKPDSFLYFFDTALEKVELFLTFDPGKKVEKTLEYAEERLAETKEVANENKPDEVLKVTGDYERQIISATKRANALNDLEKSEELINKIFENTERHYETLLSVLDNVPDEAKGAIENAIEVSKRGNEEAQRQISELKIKAAERKIIVEKFKKRLESQSKEDAKVDEIKDMGVGIRQFKISLPQIQTKQQEQKEETFEIKTESIKETFLTPFLPKPSVKPEEKAAPLPSAVVHAPSPEIEFSIFENPDDTAVLSWSASGASRCDGVNFDTGGKTEGKIIVSTDVPTDYRVTCFNKEGSSTVRTASVPIVTGVPTIDFRSLSDFSGGKKVKLTWDSKNATFCDGVGFNTRGMVTGVMKLTQEETTVYSLICTGPGGTSEGQVVAIVVPTEEALGGPTLSLEVIDKQVFLKWIAPVLGCKITGPGDFSFITDAKTGTVNAGMVQDNTSFRIFCEEVI